MATMKGACNESDPDEEADRLAARLAGDAGDDDDPNSGRVEILREPRPEPGGAEDPREADPAWAQRTAEERASAAGAAAAAKDRQKGAAGGVGGTGARGPGFGVLFNPEGYNWTDPDDLCNVHHSEHDRLAALAKGWYGKAAVGDGAVAVERDELDAWQKFAHDIVVQDRSSVKDPLRLFLLGSAGTGKSRTVRSFVGARRARVRAQWDEQVWRAQLSAQRVEQRRREDSACRSRSHAVASGGGVSSQNVLELLGVTRAEALAAEKAATSGRSRPQASGEGGVSEPPPSAKEYWSVKERMEEHVTNCCRLSAPTGCASFQLKFGASTLHRSFGVPVGYCGPWSQKQREGERFQRMKRRLMQAQLFVWTR